MTAKLVTSVVSLGGLLTAGAQPEQPPIPVFDFLRLAAVHTGEMDIDDDEGSMEVSKLEFRAILSKPITPMDGLTIVPIFNYDFTRLNFSDTLSGFPIGDEDLHSLSLSKLVLKNFGTSPWFLVGWARAEMATDFQHIDSDDFTFDLSLGVAYRFNNRFTLGAGAAVINLNGDAQVFPGISFDWIISERARIGLYGPKFLASYTPDNCWSFSLRGDPGGGDWNIRDAGGESRLIDLTSYRVGIYANRALGEKLSIEAGVGMTFANEIKISDPNGNNSFDRDLDNAWYGEIGLRLKEF